MCASSGRGVIPWVSLLVDEMCRAIVSWRWQAVSSGRPLLHLLVAVSLAVFGVSLVGCESGGADEAAPSALEDATKHGVEELTEFCGLDLGSLATEPMVVDCSCCVADAVGDYATQVGLLFGSQPVLADARVEKRGLAGKVPLWSLGPHVPEVVCNDKGQPVCTCSAKDGSWAQFEPSCKTGEACRHQPQAKEWPTVCAEGAKCPDRDKALGRQQEKAHVAADETAAAHTKTDGKQCAALPPWYTESERPKFTTRVSLGSARCEDASPEQCHFFYSKAGGTWTHCEATSTRVKQCTATAITQAEAKDAAANLEAWAVKHAYSPGAWPVRVLDDGTIEPVKTPTREEFLPHMGNLPKSNGKIYKL